MYIKKEIIIILIFLILLGAGFYLYWNTQKEINAQKLQINNLQQTIATNNDRITQLTSENASLSSQIKSIISTPTPTAAVRYVAPSHPDLSKCTMEGNFYFCSSDNCYYNPNGTKTGVCKIPFGQ